MHSILLESSQVNCSVFSILSFSVGFKGLQDPLFPSSWQTKAGLMHKKGWRGKRAFMAVVIRKEGQMET